MISTRNTALKVSTLILLLVGQVSFADPAERFVRAQQLKNEGMPEAALQELDGLRNEFPHDVDYALARAQVLVQLQRDDDALQELSVATRLAPDYEDVWKLRFAVLDRVQNEAAKTEREALQHEAAERFPDARWWEVSNDDSKTRSTLLAGAGRETLSNDQPSWNSQFVELQLERNATSQYRARISRDQRFAGADITMALGAEQSWASGWFGGVDFSVAGSPKFQPDLGYAGHLGKTLGGGWVIDLRYRRREYPSVSVGSAIGTVEKYFGDFRVAYGLGLSRLQGAANLPNHMFTVNWFYGERSSAGITVNTGKEAESIGNGQVLETDVRGVSLSGRREINERFGVQWWLGMHDQGDFYRRRFLGMAVSYRL